VRGQERFWKRTDKVVLGSWEVVKAEVQFSANQSLFPSGSPSRKRKLKEFPERASVFYRSHHSRHPPSLSIKPLFAQHFTSDSIGPKLPYAWYPHLHQRQNQWEADLVWFTKRGKRLSRGLDPLLLWVSNRVYLCVCKSKSAPVVCCVPSVLLPYAMSMYHSLRGEHTCEKPLLPSLSHVLAAERPWRPIRAATYGYSTKNAQCTRCRQKLEVKVEELGKIPPFQLAIKVAVLFFFLLLCSRVTSYTIVSSMKLIRFLTCHG
jgi:hypothetical protein